MDSKQIFSQILDLFGPETIYAQLDGAVSIYWKTIVPAIIILSIATRYLELMYENLGQGAKWSEAVKDVKAAIIFTALYAGFGAIVIKFHLVFTKMMYGHGSIQTILDSYQNFMNDIKAVQPDGYWDKLTEKIDQYSIEAILAQSLAFISMVLLALTNVLLRIIYALGFCLLYLWGMFAVPTLSTKILRITSGWFRGVMTLAIWPIIEATVYMLVDPMFGEWANKVTNMETMLTSSRIVGVALLYTFANLVLIAVSVSTFFIAVVVGTNQNMMAGLGTSMLATWGAAASLTMNGARLMKSAVTSKAATPGASVLPMGGGNNGGAPGLSQSGSNSIDGLGTNSVPTPGAGGNGGSQSPAPSSADTQNTQGENSQGSATDGISSVTQSASQTSTGGQQPNTPNKGKGDPLSKAGLGNNSSNSQSVNSNQPGGPGNKADLSNFETTGGGNQTPRQPAPNNSTGLNDLKE